MIIQPKNKKNSWVLIWLRTVAEKKQQKIETAWYHCRQVMFRTILSGKNHQGGLKCLSLFY